MATESITATNLFRVDGLIAVITGGGTGLSPARNANEYQADSPRHRAHDGESFSS